ncbi:helix-turn-helix domain-containing protein [Listeria ilorinensis]|uniref:helix-turn-helix domain-containing protein n=1 Tax=Listeria ilorinensis TaxID=2867439 RepID=UPI001EF6432C|nr:helix-turn-helix transcriptional regulator [Listeria ilorinensis]
MSFSLKERRLEKGLTLEEVGNRVGVGKSTVRKWEDGLIANMRRDNVVALAKALDISPLDILELDNDQESELHTIIRELDEDRKNELLHYAKALLVLQKQDKKGD